MWTEKYRPDSLDELINHEDIRGRLEAFVEEDEVPHMLYAGPAGTGKTTSVIALAKDLYGDDWKQNFMETNASVTPDTPILIRADGRIKGPTFSILKISTTMRTQTNMNIQMI